MRQNCLIHLYSMDSPLKWICASALVSSSNKIFYNIINHDDNPGNRTSQFPVLEVLFNHALLLLFPAGELCTGSNNEKHQKFTYSLMGD